MKKILAACAALALVVGVTSSVHSQPGVNTAQVDVKLVFRDTLPRFATDSSAVSTAPLYTDSVNVTGYRGFALYAYAPTAAADTILAVLTQVKGTAGEGVWFGTAATTIMPVGLMNNGTGAALNLDGGGKLLASHSAHYDGTAGGTPLPLRGWVRWRLRSNNARRYNAALSASFAPQGTITMYVHLVR